MSCNDTNKHVKLWYCTPLRHDSWIVGHSVVLWSNEKPWGRGLVERKACISRMKRWNLTLNETILIGCFKTAFFFYLRALGRDHRKPQKDPLSSTFIWLVFQFIVQIQCEWLISWICKRKKGKRSFKILGILVYLIALMRRMLWRAFTVLKIEVNDCSL